MTLQSDIQSDYTAIDGIEDVTVTPQNPAADAQEEVKALRRALSRRDAMALGVLSVESSYLVWHLWTVTLGVVVPKPGDTITDADSVVWNIMSAEFSHMTSRWRCVCIRQVS